LSTLLGAGVKDRCAAADVADVEATTASGARCPRCSAAVRPGAPWCTQCYAATTPAPADPQRPAPAGSVLVAERPAQAESGGRPGSPGGAPTTGSWPCSACSRTNSLDLAACEGCGTPFLAAARDARPTVVLPVVGDVLALSPVRRVALAVALVVAFVLLTSLGALLLA
jgi:DNA-directed RNA polymerase subunit RPC12/RpoP